MIIPSLPPSSPFLQAAQTHYTQLFQHFPILERAYFPFEKNFRAEPFVDFAKATWPLLPLALCTAYALMIVIGTRVMKNRSVGQSVCPSFPTLPPSFPSCLYPSAGCGCT